MIYYDISEDQRIKDKIKDRFGENCKEKELGIWDCKQRKVPMKLGESPYICVIEEEAESLMDIGYFPIKKPCKDCKYSKYVRFADIEIGEARAFFERKTAKDFAASQKDRLYDQMDRMDTFIKDYHKGIILEGMPKRWTFIYDSFAKQKQERQRFDAMSPLQQAIKFSRNPNWTLSFIREAKARNMEFIQTWNIDETLEFIHQCDLGLGKEPKIRIKPKRYPNISLERNILIQYKGVGKVRSKRLLENEDIIKTIQKLTFLIEKEGYEQD